MLQHGREIAPSVSWEILVHVKRTGGISVNELAALLKMSYMGVKQHCDALKRRGYLDTWRRPKATGRPEKIFRPTVKLDLVLPNWGNELCFNMLAFSAQTQGESAPERLLHSFLQQKAEQWASKIKAKTLAERARQFIKIRNNEGWMSEIIQEGTQLQIIEHHSPLSEIARIYPAVWAIESRALEHCFEGEVIRQQHEAHSLLILPGQAVPGEFPTATPAAEPTKIKTTAARKAEKTPTPIKTASVAPIAAKAPEPKPEPEPEPEPAPITQLPPTPTPVQKQEPATPSIAAQPIPTPPTKSSPSKKRSEPQGLLFDFD